MVQAIKVDELVPVYRMSFENGWHISLSLSAGGFNVFGELQGQASRLSPDMQMDSTVGQLVASGLATAGTLLCSALLRNAHRYYLTWLPDNSAIACSKFGDLRPHTKGSGQKATALSLLGLTKDRGCVFASQDPSFKDCALCILHKVCASSP
jgi:hypothetical protein